MLGRCRDQKCGSEKSIRHVQKSELCLVNSFKKNEQFQVAKIVGDESLGSDYQGPLELT